MPKILDARAALIVAALWGYCALSPVSWAEGASVETGSALDRGFSGLYNLDFAGAQKDFATWQQLHPDDPVGPVSEAAGFLFSEFNRLGVLEAQFFENDVQAAIKVDVCPLRPQFLPEFVAADDLSRPFQQ